MQELLTAIFCDVDDFCKDFEHYCKTHLLSENIEDNRFFPKSQMTMSEVVTIVIFFHLDCCGLCRVGKCGIICIGRWNNYAK
jgi:hypothetical protein